MSTSFDVTCCITVNSFRSAASGQLLFSVEIRRENSVTQLDSYESEAHAIARARAVARKLSALLDAAQELLD